MLIAISVYENDAGQKAFGISEVNPCGLVQGYLLPIAIFVIALVLVRRKKSQNSSIVTGPHLRRRTDSHEQVKTTYTL